MKNKLESEAAAFPFEHKFMDGTMASRGMTLRDYFAAKALPSLVSLTSLTDDDVAKQAYEIADAMIKARKA